MQGRRRKRGAPPLWHVVTPLLLLGGIGSVSGVFSSQAVADAVRSGSVDGPSISNCGAVDGDTLRCGNERV